MSNRQGSFTPPTAGQLAELLRRHPPAGPSKLAAWGPLAALALAVLLVLAVESGPLLAAPWLILIGLFVAAAVRTGRLRQLEARAGQAQELALLGRDVPALRLAWRLVPAAAAVPALHHRLVAVITHCLDHLRAPEQALVGYDHLLAQMPEQHPGAVLLRVRRTMVQLALDHLADADDALRRLRHLAPTQPPTPASAAYHWARLLQCLRTWHDDEALPLADDLCVHLQPLGVEAGYGYALLAMAFHRSAARATTGPADGDVETSPSQTGEDRLRQAGIWWSRATLLLSAAALVQRYPELRSLLDDPGMMRISRSPMPPVVETP